MIYNQFLNFLLYFLITETTFNFIIKIIEFSLTLWRE